MHGLAEGPEHLTLFGHVDALEGIYIGRVDGEKLGELLQPFGHAMVEGRELAQMFGDLGQLPVALAQQTVRDHEGDVLTGDAHLFETVAHAA